MAVDIVEGMMKVSGLPVEASYYAFCGKRRRGLNTFDGEDPSKLFKSEWAETLVG